MISNELDVSYWRNRLVQAGRVQIPGFLQGDAASALRECLLHEVPWESAERGQPPQAADANEPPGADTYARAGEGFHFHYDRYLMAAARREGSNLHLLVHRVLEFFNMPQFLEFARYLGNDPQIGVVGAQATRYRSGQFLREHDDRQDEEQRRYAYVINLSTDWQADWGGLLQFIDAKGSVVDTFLPRWNSLSIFRVPVRHCVTMVAPWALQPRLAITGWWHAADYVAKAD